MSRYRRLEAAAWIASIVLAVVGLVELAIKLMHERRGPVHAGLFLFGRHRSFRGYFSDDR